MIRIAAKRRIAGLMVGVCLVLSGMTIGLSDDFSLIDMDFVLNAPLDSRVLSVSEADGVITEEVEFVGGTDPEGALFRTAGFLSRPANGERFPVMLWCTGGMGRAQKDGFTSELARRGFLTLSMDRPNDVWDFRGRFNTEKPQDANYIRFAVAYMRGITYLLSRPEADPGRVGIAGSSYGGVFSTLVSGLDHRIHAGMSFFSGGNHHLGTNLPQFNALENMEQVAIFRHTGDGAYHQARRSIPFFWGIAANDSWFHLPAVVQTWREAQSPEKRMGIVPLWDHGFPEIFDKQLLDWFDIHLHGTREPYNRPGQILLKRVGDDLVAEWDWTGANAITKAELVVSYGDALPWHGWVHRLYHTVPAEINGHRARAVVPVAESDIDMLMFGNLTDENQVLVSTEPVTVRAGHFGVEPRRSEIPEPDGCPWGDFEPESAYVLDRFSLFPQLGIIDTDVFHEGRQSLKVTPDMAYRTKNQPMRLKLFNVYARGHRLRLSLRSDQKAEAVIRVRGLAPRHWQNRRDPAPKAILSTMPQSWLHTDRGDLPVFEKPVATDATWQTFELDCPFTDRAVDGYVFELQFSEDSSATFWVDDIRFIPVWREERGGGR